MADIRGFWAGLRESLWFVPTLIVFGAIGLALGMVELSAVVGFEALARWPRIFGAGADGARSMLSAIAGSMITVAGVIFSITIVAVTQASTQYSPLVLRNFMRDRANQSVLGIFVGIFTYCLVVLRTIRGGAEGAFVPSLAVVMGVLLALLGVGILIFFVHHIATILQAAEIAARIANDTGHAMDTLYPEEQGEEPAPAPAGVASEPRDGGGTAVPAPATGYLQRVDLAGLVRLAKAEDLVIRLRREPGDFVIEGQPIATLEPAVHPDLPRRVSRRFLVSTYRTFEQDVGFGLRQLVDMAMKALSAGVNDTTTAVTCVDYAGSLVVRLCNRRIELSHRDSGGAVRVVAAGPSFESLLALATDEVRQHAQGNVSVLARQLEMLGTVARVTRSSARRGAVHRQIELVRGTAATTVRASYDREVLEACARAAAEAASHDQ
jgi:uncharacterized membrane protein